MHSREANEPQPCGRCGALSKRFYTLSDAERPHLCSHCFRALLKMIDTLALVEAPQRRETWTVTHTSRARFVA